jgi:hypothetical protein
MKRKKIFMTKLKGRCFNCFAKDHFRHICREPTKCWRCNKTGHTSPSCSLPQSNLATSTPRQNSSQNYASSFELAPSIASPMDRHCSFGPTSAGIEASGPRDDGVRGRSRESRGSVVNYPDNPRFRPRVAFKFANTSEEMEQMCIMLTNHALVISDEGLLAVQSREEVKDLIIQHFDIRKHELYVYRSHPEPFIIVFSEGRARDFVFATRRLVEGPTELSFHSWDLDQFGTRDCIPYHVRRCIEGIPHHAWCRETTER